jgi:hypothetical protein
MYVKVVVNNFKIFFTGGFEDNHEEAVTTIGPWLGFKLITNLMCVNCYHCANLLHYLDYDHVRRVFHFVFQ